jgi:hypothetical protein
VDHLSDDKPTADEKLAAYNQSLTGEMTQARRGANDWVLTAAVRTVVEEAAAGTVELVEAYSPSNFTSVALSWAYH